MAKRRRPKHNLASMDAKEQLYGSRLTRARVARIIMTYELGVGSFCYVLYGPKNLLLILIWMIIAAIYIYRSVLPMSVDANYLRRATTERNKFINIVTQGMTVQDAQILSVLENATDKIEGLFQRDMQHLLAILVSSGDRKEEHQAFLDIENKYKSDIYFVLFMEQVETVYYESVYHIETFEAFKDSHNILLAHQREFIQKKGEIQNNLIIICVVSLATEAICLFSNGYNNYLTTYAMNPLGIGISTIYLIIMGLIIHGFYKNYFDDDVTSY